MPPDHHFEILDLRNEIERLRGIVEFSEAASRQQREGFQAEIARLRSDARAYANVALSEENDALIAEIERLKALIRELLYSIGHDRKDLMDETADRARAALEGKP